MKKIFYTIFLLTLFCNSLSQNVTLYVSRGIERASEMTLDASKCNPTLPLAFNKSVTSINTHNFCVQLYEQEYCSSQGPDDYLIVRPGSPAHDDLNFYGFSKKTSSIGPCFEKCHADNIDKSETGIIELFGKEKNHNNNPIYEVEINSEKCVDISTEMENWSEPQFRVRVSTMYCMELHEFADCTGKSNQLTVGRRNVFDKKVIHWPDKDKTRSVSFCGYNCNHTDIDGDIEPPPFTVALYKLEDFNGQKKHVTLTSCTLLPEGWKDNGTMSIIPFKNCVALYKDEDCGYLLEEIIGAKTYIHYQNMASLKQCDNFVDDEELNEGGDSWWIKTLIFFLLLCGGVGLFLLYKKETEKVMPHVVGRTRLEEDKNVYSYNRSNGFETPLIDAE